jgi:hypothetical protein
LHKLSFTQPADFVSADLSGLEAPIKQLFLMGSGTSSRECSAITAAAAAAGNDGPMMIHGGNLGMCW